MTEPPSYRDVVLLNERVRNREALLHNIIDKWEILAGGKAHKPEEVERWLRHEMAPAINWARRHLGRPRPDGTLP
jgi:hypothetical protein